MRFRLWAFLLLALLASPAARAQPLVADLSRHLVAITTGFTGAEVLLFGAIEGGGDVIVVLRGPERREILRRKDSVGIFWINTASLAFRGVPGFYAVASTRPLHELAAEPVLRGYQLGTGRLRLEALGARLSENLSERWRAALIETKVHSGLFAERIGEVTLLGDRLFRTTIRLPPNVPVGAYRAEIYLLREGQVISAQTTPLIVSKTGLEAEVVAFARRRPRFYGLLAVLLAIAAGTAAHLTLRRS